MQHVSALVVNERPIFARRMQPIRKHERLVFTRSFHFLIVRAIRLDLLHVSRAAEAMFEIRRGDETRDSLVEPEVIPVTTSHHVAPPLMRKLVRAEPNILFVIEHLLSVIFFQCCKAAHLLLDTAGCEHLCVRSVGILNAGACFEEVEHVGRVAKDTAHFAFTVVGREILKLDVSAFLLNYLKWTSRKTENVSGNRSTLLPLRDTSIVWQCALRNELAVGDRC